MRKIHNSDSRVIPPVKIYWDDLQEICDRVKVGRKIRIESGGYEYENLEELKAKTKKTYIRQIQISGYGDSFKDQIIVCIAPNQVLIYEAEGSTETAAKIKELLQARSPWYMYYSYSVAWGFFSVIISWGGSLLLAFLAFRIQNVFEKLAIYITGVVIVLWSFKTVPILGRTKVFTYIKKDRMGFWESNKEDIYKDLIVGGVLFVLGYVTGNNS